MSEPRVLDYEEALAALLCFVGTEVQVSLTAGTGPNRPTVVVFGVLERGEIAEDVDGLLYAGDEAFDLRIAGPDGEHGYFEVPRATFRYAMFDEAGEALGLFFLLPGRADTDKDLILVTPRRARDGA